MSYNAGDTLTVKGSGGAISQVDVPADGTHRREQFDEMVRKGEYTILNDDGSPVYATAEPVTVDPDGVDAVPVGNVDEVVAWVRGSADGEDPSEGWEVRAQRALDTEQAAEKPRKGLVKALTDLVSADV